ncbi:unnamed protein product [Spirodela intermedia]|uniref:Uncharacterized protein n=1 Tax=Spirodela intermedia TaxID=51605 RepID=A0A7I8IDR6_SPIIN|nr:unnamed protein product [Spirodela intermedia]CAA6655930.1 unnamed protein product [Spirodela intermedia]
MAGFHLSFKQAAGLTFLCSLVDE